MTNFGLDIKCKKSNGALTCSTVGLTLLVLYRCEAFVRWTNPNSNPNNSTESHVLLLTHPNSWGWVLAIMRMWMKRDQNFHLDVCLHICGGLCRHADLWIVDAVLWTVTSPTLKPFQEGVNNQTFSRLFQLKDGRLNLSTGMP